MLTIRDPLSRRDFLRIGSLGLGTLSAANLLSAAPSTPQAIKNKAVVFVFMYGGPSQFETFDPKPNAPERIRTITDVIPTAVPGVHFGSSFPRIATLANQVTILRSYVPSPETSNHGIRPVVCSETFDSNLGSAYSSVVGGNHPETGLPTNIMMYPRSVLTDPMGISSGSERLAPRVFMALPTLRSFPAAAARLSATCVSTCPSAGFRTDVACFTLSTRPSVPWIEPRARGQIPHAIGPLPC